MSMVIRLKVPIEMHYTVIPMGTSKVNSSPGEGAGGVWGEGRATTPDPTHVIFL